jgi:hypothetical protein
MCISLSNRMMSSGLQVSQVLMDVIFVKMMTVKKKLKLIYKSVYVYKYNFLFMKEVCKFVFTSW